MPSCCIDSLRIASREAEYSPRKLIKALPLILLRLTNVIEMPGPTSLFRPPLLAPWRLATSLLVGTHHRDRFAVYDCTRYTFASTFVRFTGNKDLMELELKFCVLAARIKRLLTAAEKQAGRPAPRRPPL